MEELFKEYDETTGIGDLFFENQHKAHQYRFYRRRNEWDETYMVEFSSDSNNYRLYWGHYEAERGLTDVTELLLPPNLNGEWKHVRLDSCCVCNLSQIINSVHKEIIEYLKI